MEDKVKNKKPNKRLLERKLTSDRRKAMKIVVLSFNFSNNKLSTSDKTYLNTLLHEAKYYYNYLLYLSEQTITDDFGDLIYPHNIFNFDTKINDIKVYDSSIKEFFDYELKLLSSQMKQKIKDKLIHNIKGLSEKKKLGFKIGKLKYKSSVNVPLKQYNNTYRLDDDFKYLSIQGNSKKYFKLNPNKALNKLSHELGFKSLSINKLLSNEIIELANAEIIKTNNKFQFKLTIYINPVVFNRNTQEELIKNIKKENNKPYQAIKINPNRTDFLNTRIKALSKPIENHVVNNPVGLDNIFNNIKKHNEVKKYGEVKQFHMNLTQEQLDLLSNTSVGIDAGIADEMTFNCGELYQSFSVNSQQNIYLQKTLNKIKLAQTELNIFIQRSKRLNRGKSKLYSNSNVSYKSRQYDKLRNKLNKLWNKYENIKDNMVNHIVSLLKHFNKVYFQDEMIKSWHQNKLKGYSKKIQQGILGKVYAKLKSLAKTEPKKYIMLSKSLRTTKSCVCCQKINPIKLSDRIYSCGCGYRNKRDSHSAYNMILMGNNNALNKKVSGMETSNLVQDLTTISTTQLIHDVVVDKLISKSHINSKIEFYESIPEAHAFRLG